MFKECHCANVPVFQYFNSVNVNIVKIIIRGDAVSISGKGGKTAFTDVYLNISCFRCNTSEGCPNLAEVVHNHLQQQQGDKFSSVNIHDVTWIFKCIRYITYVYVKKQWTENVHKPKRWKRNFAADGYFLELYILYLKQSNVEYKVSIICESTIVQ